VDGVATAMSLESDKWMDLSFDTNQAKLLKNKLWIAAKIGFDPGWFTNRGWSTTGVDMMFVGKTDDEIATNLFNEPHIYIYIRKVKNGSGRVFTPDKIKLLSEKVIDAIVIDYNKYWLLNSKTIYDMHSGKAIETLVKGLTWLMIHGYINTKPILIRASQWFLTNYTPIFGQSIVDNNYTVCMGNFWDDKKGPVAVDFQGLIDNLMLIPDTFHPPYLGRPNVLNISENYFILPEVSTGTIGLNVYNGNIDQMKSFYTDWAARSGSIVPPPPPPVPITKKYFIPTVTNLNMRSSPTNTTLTNKVGLATINAENEILDEKQADGYLWVKCHAWMATDGFGKIIEK